MNPKGFTRRDREIDTRLFWQQSLRHQERVGQ
jgi:hypothetical protein